MTIADKRPAPIANPAPVPLMTRASDITYKPITWLWPGRIARAKLTLLAGAPGSGTSSLATRLMATVTTGGAYPCGEGRAPQGSVMLVSPDSDPDVLIPRLKAAGADLARVQIVGDVPGATGPRPFDLASDVPLLDGLLRTVRDLRLIVIDAVHLSAGRAAAARNARAQLDALAKLAQNHDVSVIAILKPGNAGRGSGNVTAINPLVLGAARALFVIETDLADKSRQFLLQVKNELGPDRGMIAFRISTQELEPGQTVARTEFEPQHHPLSQREFTARQARSFDSAKAEAIEFVHGVFGSASELNVRHIEQEARAAGLLRANQALTQCRVLRDARMAMGLVMTRDGSNTGAWVWATPKASPTVQLKSAA